MRLLPKPLRDNWRYHLDPRDPDYLEPPIEKEIDDIDDIEKVCKSHLTSTARQVTPGSKKISAHHIRSY